MINQDIDKVLWYYTESQPLYDDMEMYVDFIGGILDTLKTY